MTPDWQIYQDIMRCIETYMGQENCRHERFETWPYPQRICEISRMLKLHVLRESGDIKRYIELHTKMVALPGYQATKEDIATFSIVCWLHTELESMKIVKPEKEGLVISMLVYGEKYLYSMLNYTLKSMMADGNLPAIASLKDTTIHFITDKKTKTAMEESPIAKAVNAIGVKFSYSIIPDSIISAMRGELIFWLLGAAAAIGIAYARKTGCAYHHSLPDCIYSDKYFSELLRLSKRHTSIVAPGIRGDEGMMIEAIKDYDKGNCISISSSKLAAVSLNCLYMSFNAIVVNNRPKKWQYPQNHSILWESEDTLHANCPHVNALWLAHSVIKDMPDRYLMTIDSELDLICKGEDFYIPQPEDELFLGDMTEPTRDLIRDEYENAHAHADRLWRVITHRDSLKFYLRGQRTIIDRTVRPIPANFLTNQQIYVEKGFLFNSCLSIDPYEHITLARPRTHLGRMFSG